MSFTETLEALGSWDLELSEETPADVLTKVGYFGHLVVIDGQVDVEATGNALLAGARYVGVCLEVGKPDTYLRSGAGLLNWIGDADGKGHTILNEISLTNATLAQVVTALLPSTVTVGTVFPQASPATRYTGKHVFQSRRDALALGLAPFGAEMRVNGNFTVDVGTPAQLYDTQLPLTSKPSPMIVRRGAGSDPDLVTVGGKVETEGSVVDYSTSIRVMGQTIGVGDEPDTVFVVGSADAPSVPWKDPQGAAVKMVRLISASSETEGSAPATAQLNLNRFNRATSAIKVTADDYEISGGFGVGDAAYVYDPDSEIFDPANQVLFHGEVIHPAIIRVSSLTTPIVEGMTVAWRTDAGVWLDLTRWVVWESAGAREITVGDRDKTLSKPSNAIQDRVDAARGNPSTKVPKTPTGLTLSTSSVLNGAGNDLAIITAAWNPVTQYVDDTSVALHHYEVQFRPQFRSPSWTGSTADDASPVDIYVAPALGHDVQVRAVSTGGIPSAWSATQSIVSAADSTGPDAPADAVLTQSLGQIRVSYPGTTNVGGPMPSDANRVDVEVASAGSSGPFVVESSLNPFVEGIHRVGGTPGQTRWVRLRAYDHNGNGSAYSATVSAVIPQVTDGEIASLSVGKLTAGTLSADVTIAGRFTTSPTGARREMNAVGFQAFNAANALLINLDGVNNLLTGIYQTALTGRRIVIGSGGTTGRLQFIAPDGTFGEVQGFTGTVGSVSGEAIRMGIPVAGAYGAWNGIQVENDQQIFVNSQYVNITVGGRNNAADGFFVYYAANKGSAGAVWSSSPRLQIDNRNFVTRDTLGRAMYHTTSESAIYLHRFYTYSNDNPANPVYDGFLEISYSYRPDVSSALKFFTRVQANGGVYGGLIRYWVNVPAYNNPRFEFWDPSLTTLIDLWANAFTVGSDESRKDGIRDLEDPTSTLRAMRVRTWDEIEGQSVDLPPEVDDQGSKPRKTGVTKARKGRIGLVAQEAPPEVVVDGGGDVGKGIDLYATIGVLIGSAQKTLDRLEALEARVA